MEIIQSPQVGQPIPDFSLPSIQGDEIRVDSYRGKKLVIFMWASW
jgi:peroxiredoxin